ncbi:hypothetical protein ACRRTK_012170 [Alexandromys fortis]
MLALPPSSSLSCLPEKLMNLRKPTVGSKCPQMHFLPGEEKAPRYRTCLFHKPAK